MRQIPEHLQPKLEEAIELRLEDCTSTDEFFDMLMDELADEWNRNKASFENAESFAAKSAELFKTAEKKCHEYKREQLESDGIFIHESIRERQE